MSHVGLSPSVAGVDAEANLAWDRSGGPHNGRAYLLYTDAASPNAATPMSAPCIAD